MGEVDRRQCQLLAGDVLPDIEFGPVGDREDTHVLARMNACVVQIPELRTLGFGIPLTEVITERKNPLFRPGFFFVTAGAADAGIEFVFRNGFQQSHSLRGIARIRLRIAQTNRAAFNRIFN